MIDYYLIYVELNQQVNNLLFFLGKYPFFFFKHIMATLRYRISTNWEYYHTRECSSKEHALKLAYSYTIGDFGISIGDISIDGKSYTIKEIEQELKELD